jgi:cysteinyl-tRNA synthetase
MVLKRASEQLLDLPVRLAINITDISDKIYTAAAAQGVPSALLAEQMSEAYRSDTDALGLGRPDVEPLATTTIAEIIALIERLISNGAAYATDEGDVYFSVAAFPHYGELSGQRPDELIAGSRVEPGEDKRAPLDFALWKATKPGEDTAWDSPWGPGRPGWHIECSAMAHAELGEDFDVHGGGLDLIFPHHENERAQSEAAGERFARVWMHNGMLRLTGEKMSKSLGNIVSLRDALEKWGRETILLFFMTAQWRKPIDFSDELMSQAAAQAETFRNYFVGLEYEPEDLERDELGRVLDDDFNTPEALALFHDWRGRGRTASLRWGLELFGLGSLAETVAAPAEIVALAEQRKEARASGDFEEADRLRGEVEAKGWEVRDVVEGFELVPK